MYVYMYCWVVKFPREMLQRGCREVAEVVESTRRSFHIIYLQADSGSGTGMHRLSPRRGKWLGSKKRCQDKNRAGVFLSFVVNHVDKPYLSWMGSDEVFCSVWMMP